MTEKQALVTDALDLAGRLMEEEQFLKGAIERAPESLKKELTVVLDRRSALRTDVQKRLGAAVIALPADAFEYVAEEAPVEEKPPEDEKPIEGEAIPVALPVRGG